MQSIFRVFPHSFPLNIRDSNSVFNDIVTGGLWDTEGCYSEGVSEDGLVVKCACTHFTNFALLVSPEGQVGESSLELTIISTIGAALSLVGMVLTIVAHGGMRYDWFIVTQCRRVSF